MKNIALTVATLLLPLFSYAQSPGFMILYDKYTGRDGFTTIDMSGEMFRAVTSGNTRTIEDGEVERIIIIVAETDQDAFRSDVEQMFAAGEYDRVSTVRNGGQKVEFYLMKGDGNYREFLMNITGSTEHVIMLVTGNGLTINSVREITGNATAS